MVLTVNAHFLTPFNTCSATPAMVADVCACVQQQYPHLAVIVAIVVCLSANIEKGVAPMPSTAMKS